MCKLPRATHLLLLAIVSLAAPAESEELPCSPDTIGAFVTRVTMEVSDEFNRPTDERTKGAALDEVAARASGDGLAESRLDLVRRAFLALDLGEVKEEDDRLVFNFNPSGDAIGLFSPRAIVHQPALFAPLLEHLDGLQDPDVRAATKKSFDEGLGDFDDVELRVRWTPPGDTPEARVEALTPYARVVFDAAWEKAGGPAELAELIADESASFGADVARSLRLEARGAPADALVDVDRPLDTRMDEICKHFPITKALVAAFVDRLRAQGTELLGSLHSDLTEDGFFALADVLETEPKWVGEGSFRQRNGAVGPDEFAVSLRYQVGVAWLTGSTREGKLQAMSLGDTLALATKLAESSLPTLSLEVDYSRSEEFSISVPEQSAAFVVDGTERLSARLLAGGFLDRARQRRWELDASYDDVSDDPTRQNRFVGTVSWVEKLAPELVSLAGGSELVVSFVYANKPEFRGEVDEEFGMRAGLKWSLGDGSEGSPGD